MNGGPSNLHASAVVIGERGVLIRGASGTGKTTLALALVERARGTFARLVADDRTLVARHGDRLVARPHPALAGLVERRGLGIGPIEHEPACVLTLVVDLVEGRPERQPSPDASGCEVAGVVLPRVAAAARSPASADLVLAALTMKVTVP